MALKLALTAYPEPQHAVADLIGIKESALSKIVHGRQTPTDKQKKLLSSLLGKPMSKLFPKNSSR